MSIVTLRTPRLTIEGRSRAGNETWFRVRELGVSLDIGRCPDTLVALQHIFITHAHLDHALGVPFYAAQRRLFRLGPGQVFVPAETVDDYRELMAIHERMEGTDYPVHFVPLGPGQRHEVRRDLSVRAHRATHRVPANAWEFTETRHRLKAELTGVPGRELARLRRQGHEVENRFERPILFYSGDTDGRIFETSPALFEAEVLMLECSFTGRGEEERGRRYTHIHLSEIVAQAERFRNEWIILTHFSLRDRPETIHRRVYRELPAFLRERVLLALPAPFTGFNP